MQSSDTAARLMDDFRFWCETGVRILTEDDKDTGFAFNPAQVRTSVAEDEARARGLHAMLVLKARRHGVTTYQQARSLHLCWSTPNATCLTLAHSDDATSRIFSRQALYMYEHLPDILRPKRRGDGTRSIVFDKLNSSLEIITAGGKGPGRGSNLSRVHVSEAAYVDQSKMPNLRAGLMEAARAGWYVEESTANGCAGLFYTTCLETMKTAQEASGGVWYGRNRWCLIFLPWFLDPRNVADPAGLTPEVPRGDETAEQVAGERRVVEIGRVTYGVEVTAAHLAWRRSKRASEDARAIFPQENAETPEEAFLASSGSRFRVAAISDGLAACRAPLHRERECQGETITWAEPDPQRWYLVACDTSEGTIDGDPQYVTVHDGGTFQQVAAWSGRAGTREQGKHAATLARRYNGAVLAVERQNHGHAVILAIEDDQYGNFYVGGDGKLGWSTDPVSRPAMVDSLAVAVDEGALAGVVHDPDFWREGLTFERQATGKYEARRPNHDDRVMAVAQALAVRASLSTPSPDCWEIPTSATPGGYGA